MRKKLGPYRPDEIVARIAARQHGVITTGQLLNAGVQPSGITKRLKGGRLHRIHRSVYAVGHAGLGNEGRWMAGVLALGNRAVLSHRSAAALWRIWRRRNRDSPVKMVEVSVPRRGGRASRAGLRVHRSSTLRADDCTVVRGIPVTTARRTLQDLRRVLPRVEFAAAMREAEFLRLDIGPEVATDRTRSELEARLLAICRRHRIPQPKVNVRVGAFVVDFLWSERRLVVVVDGWESHRSRSAFESDRARDVELAMPAYEVLRFTWKRVTEDPGGVAEAIRSLLNN